MTNKTRQQGMTLMGFVMVLFVVGIFAFVGIKLFPVYSEYYAVVADMRGVASEPGIAQAEPSTVRDKLFRRFYISYVTSVKPENVKVTRDNGYNLHVTYEVRSPLVYNLDFVAKFDKTIDLTRGGDD
jgi:Tfp pilus assembly major pilin PilA